MWRKPATAALLVAAVLLCGPGSAAAHGVFGSETSIWLASFHVVTSPLALAALLGLVALLFGLQEPLSFYVSGIAAAAAVLATVLLPQLPPLLAPLVVLVMGLAAVLAWKPPAAAALLMAALAGLAAGLAAGIEAPRWLDLLFLALTIAVGSFWLLATAENLNRMPRLQHIIPIARRVIGSWVAALALLLCALQLFGKHAAG